MKPLRLGDVVIMLHDDVVEANQQIKPLIEFGDYNPNDHWVVVSEEVRQARDLWRGDSWEERTLVLYNMRNENEIVVDQGEGHSEIMLKGRQAFTKAKVEISINYQGQSLIGERL